MNRFSDMEKFVYKKKPRFKKPRKCQDCKQMKPDVEVRFCPKANELNNEQIKILVCNDCFDNREGEI